MSTELTVSGNGGGLPSLRNALMPRSFGEVMTFANEIANSSFVGKDFRGKPGEIIAAITYGAELGLSPMQALQSVAVINGKPSIYGDGLLAVCQNHPQWAGKEEYLKGDTAHCIVRRKGEPDVHSTFSVADAKAAGLLGKMGPWTQYQSRMLQMRARGFALRDQYADALKGLISEAEARDYPPVGPDRARNVTPPGPIVDPAETETAVEVWAANGEPEVIMPADLDRWIGEQLAGCTDEQLATLVDNNPAVDGNPQVNQNIHVLKIHLAASLERETRRAKAAKPNGNGHAKANPEVNRLYKAAKAALEANDYTAAVKAKVAAFDLTEDAELRGKFDALFQWHDTAQQSTVDAEQRELV